MKKFDKLAWQRNNRKKNRPRYSGYLRNRLHTLRDECRTKLGNRCSNQHCKWINEDGTTGCTDQRCLQIDHVNGDGHKERKKFKNCGRYGFYLKVLKDRKGNYQLLCANCNWIKRYINKEFSVQTFKFNKQAEGII